MLILDFIKNTKAVAAIEFALALPLLALVFSALINLGLLISTKIELTGVVSVGMLYAFGNNATPAQVQTAMINATNLTPLTVTVNQYCECLNGSFPVCGSLCSDGKAVAKYDTVTATTQVNMLVPYFPIQNPFPITVSGTIRTQ